MHSAENIAQCSPSNHAYAIDTSLKTGVPQPFDRRSAHFVSSNLDSSILYK